MSNGPTLTASISCSCRVVHNITGRAFLQWHPDCEMHGDAPEAVAARERMKAVEDVATMQDRIARALVLVEGLKVPTNGTMRTALDRRDVEAHNARVNEALAVLWGDDASKGTP